MGNNDYRYNSLIIFDGVQDLQYPGK